MKHIPLPSMANGGSARPSLSTTSQSTLSSCVSATVIEVVCPFGKFGGGFS